MTATPASMRATKRYFIFLPSNPLAAWALNTAIVRRITSAASPISNSFRSLSWNEDQSGSAAPPSSTHVHAGLRRPALHLPSGRDVRLREGDFGLETERKGSPRVFQHQVGGPL